MVTRKKTRSFYTEVFFFLIFLLLAHWNSYNIYSHTHFYNTLERHVMPAMTIVGNYRTYKIHHRSLVNTYFFLLFLKINIAGYVMY